MNTITVKRSKISLKTSTLLPKSKIPKSLWDTAGILKDRATDLKKHMKKVRGEWSR